MPGSKVSKGNLCLAFLEGPEYRNCEFKFGCRWAPWLWRSVTVGPKTKAGKWIKSIRDKTFTASQTESIKMCCCSIVQPISRSKPIRRFQSINYLTIFGKFNTKGGFSSRSPVKRADLNHWLKMFRKSFAGFRWYSRICIVYCILHMETDNDRAYHLRQKCELEICFVINKGFIIVSNIHI